MHKKFKYYEEVNCFLDGNKRAIVFHNNKHVFSYLNKKGYPSVVIEDAIEYINDLGEIEYQIDKEIWFFQNEDMKTEFLNSEYYCLLSKDGIRDIEKTGLILGFPPFACSEFAYRLYYVDENYPEEHYSDMHFINGIIVQYNNMHFVSYTSTIHDDLNWLLDNNPLKDGKKIIIDRNNIFVTGRKEWKTKLFECVDMVIDKRLNHAKDNNLIIR